MKWRISKSLMNAFDDYMNGNECGKLFEAIYLRKTHQSTPSDAMLKGNRFEYLSIGTLNRDGSIPSEIKTNAGNISKTDEERAKKQADNFLKSLEFHGIEIDEKDHKFEIEFSDFTLVFITDYIGHWKESGKPIIGDLKYSGLLGNKWEETGWHRETLHQRRKLMTQPLLYLYGMKWLREKEHDFLFHVHSSTNDIDYEIFQIFITPTHLNEMEERIYNLNRNIYLTYEMGGFQYRPSVRRCLDCPVKDCPKRMTIPPIRQIYMIW